MRVALLLAGLLAGCGARSAPPGDAFPAAVRGAQPRPTDTWGVPLQVRCRATLSVVEWSVTTAAGATLNQPPVDLDRILSPGRHLVPLPPVTIDGAARVQGTLHLRCPLARPVRYPFSLTAPPPPSAPVDPAP